MNLKSTESALIVMSKSPRIAITLPPSKGVGTGNLRTAQRWLGIFIELGYDARILGPEEALDCEVLVALNAVKSIDAITRFHHQQPRGQLVVAVTGTDMNRQESDAWQNSMAWADRLVVLQARAKDSLAAELQSKAHLIHQGVRLPANLASTGAGEGFQVCVVGHLRKEKDPLLTAMAARVLEDDSRIQIVQAGAILEEEFTHAVVREREMNPRYQWMGELSKMEALKLIAQSDLMVLSSTSEGGAGVIGEAVTTGTPILASRIDGVLGLLGEDYPGYFEAGSVLALAELLKRAEKDSGFYQSLKEAGAQKKLLFTPEQERENWERLLGLSLS